LFVKAFLNEPQDDWREGLAAAFTHFGGVPRMMLGDNARALVIGSDRATGTVIFQPAYLAFCRDWDVQPRACAPYRARTKGKTEAGARAPRGRVACRIARSAMTSMSWWTSTSSGSFTGHRSSRRMRGRPTRLPA
jgi:transposase